MLLPRQNQVFTSCNRQSLCWGLQCRDTFRVLPLERGEFSFIFICLFSRHLEHNEVNTELLIAFPSLNFSCPSVLISLKGNLSTSVAQVEVEESTSINPISSQLSLFLPSKPLGTALLTPHKVYPRFFYFPPPSQVTLRSCTTPLPGFSAFILVPPRSQAILFFFH